MNQARLLIVEDEAIVAADLEGRLTQLGYAVVGIAASSEQALALAVQLQPDLVLMDIRLQGEPDGIEAARELHARGQVPVVFLTACAEEATVERAKLAEPYGYLLKPFEHRELGVMIELALYKHQAERKLRESEERLRSILQTAMDGFWLADMQGRLLEVNAAYCRMSGYSAQELLALRISDLEAVESEDDVAAHYQKTMAQGEDRFETRHRRRDGSIYDVEVSVQYRPVAGGQTVAFLRDITERKRVEKALGEKEAEYRILTENLPVGIVVHNADTIIRFSNPSATHLLGLTEEQLRGKTSRDPAWRFLREDGIEMPLAEYPVHRVLSSCERIANHVVGVCRPDLEKTVWLLCNAYPVCDASGQLSQVVVTFADITERKQMEAVLREKVDELERMNKLMIGRELRMIELKREINELCRQLSLPKRYSSPDRIASESNPVNF